jgi:hypothetical protein
MIRLDEQYPALSGGLAQRPRADQEMSELVAGQNLWYDNSRGLTRRPAMRLVSQLTDGVYDNTSEPAASWGPSSITTAEYGRQAEGYVRSSYELDYEFRGQQYALFVGKDPLVSEDSRTPVNNALLLNFNGENGSTTFTDSSPNALVPTTVSGATLTTDPTKRTFGTAAGDFSSSADSYIYYAANSALSLTGAFTIRFTFTPAVSGLVSRHFFGMYGGSHGVWFQVGVSGFLECYALTSRDTSAVAPIAGTQYFIELTRTATGVLKWYINGVLQPSVWGATLLPVPSPLLEIGGGPFIGGLHAGYPCYIDSLQILVGFASRETAVPTREFTQPQLELSEPTPDTNYSPVYAVRKADGRRIVAPIPGAGVAAALALGANAAAVVGDLLVIAPRHGERHTSHPTYTVKRPWAVADNQRKLAAWVRGGAFARAYKVALVRGDTRLWVQYTTLSEAYPAKLDTSDIPVTDPEYSKKINDRTQAYNAAATAWIASALSDVTPENIATRLSSAINSSGFLGPAGSVTSAGASILIDDVTVEEVFVDDGGDGSLILAGGNTIPSASAVVAQHLPGKIVRVLPGSEGGANSFYLKAVAKDQSLGALTQVSWSEVAGEELVQSPYFVYGVIAPAADPIAYPEGRLHLALTVEELNAAAGTSFPVVAPNISGDLVTNPPPSFYEKEVSALAAFQDRLVVVCAGGAVTASQPGDYLNFFRTSALTTLSTDPVPFQIIGGEGDTVRHVVKYDRNLLLVGTQQYMIPGRNALAPGQAAASIYSSIPGMATVEPVVVSGMVFFARYNGGRTTLHAMTAGKVVEDPTVIDLTVQAPNAIASRPVKLLSTATPDTVLILTTDPRQSYLATIGPKASALWPWTISVPTDAVPGGVVAKHWSVVGAYEHEGVFNYLWQARTLTGPVSPWNVLVNYHLSSQDFRATYSNAGWWDAALGALPFVGYGDFDTFGLLSGWSGEYTAQADLVAPTNYSDKGFRVPIASTGAGAMRERRPLTVVDYRVHFSDTSYARVILGSAVWWAQVARNPGGAGELQDGGWAFRQDAGTPLTEPALTATADFLSTIPVGRLVHQASVSVRSAGKHPFTISGVKWTGALHVRSDRG